jgi:hypothetical protein
MSPLVGVAFMHCLRSCRMGRVITLTFIKSKDSWSRKASCNSLARLNPRSGYMDFGRCLPKVASKRRFENLCITRVTATFAFAIGTNSL